MSIATNGYFRFGSLYSATYNVKVFHKNTLDAPGYDFTSYTVPGRNGDFYLGNNRFPNKIISYDCIITGENAEENLTNFKNYLLSLTGYKDLRDSFHQSEVYKAFYVGDFNVVTDPTVDMIKFTVEFSRKPQRFLTSGQSAISYPSSITNPTRFDCKPLIRMGGVGTLGIGDNSITITENVDMLFVDCETMEAYYNGTFYNDKIEVQGNDFPVLHPGANNITTEITLGSVAITPRWYIL